MGLRGTGLARRTGFYFLLAEKSQGWNGDRSSYVFTGARRAGVHVLLYVVAHRVGFYLVAEVAGTAPGLPRRVHRTRYFLQGRRGGRHAL